MDQANYANALKWASAHLQPTTATTVPEKSVNWFWLVAIAILFLVFVWYACRNYQPPNTESSSSPPIKKDPPPAPSS